LETAGAYPRGHARPRVLIARAGFELQDAVEVLRSGGLHADAVADLRRAAASIERARRGAGRKRHLNTALAAIAAARARLEE
ncbi:MAG: hypothetical protein ACREB5_12710, partial [Sphingomonadaceae bacterium]